MSKSPCEQDETLLDALYSMEHFYEQIMEYYKSHLDEREAVYEEVEVDSEEYYDV